MSFNNVLDSMKSKLSAIAGVKSCAVGLETNLSPKDYPLVRLVPVQFRKSDKAAHYRLCDLSVYFGLPLTEGKVGLEEVYNQLLAMEERVIDATRIGEAYRSTYVKTLVSTNEIEHYKLCCVFLEVEFEA